MPGLIWTALHVPAWLTAHVWARVLSWWSYPATALARLADGH